MKIGVNYLAEVKELIEEGKLDFLDYIKLYSLNNDLSPLSWCLDHRWVMFHGTIGKSSRFADKDLIKNTDVEETINVLKATKAPYISCHIASREEISLDEMLENIKNNVKEFKNAFGYDIALENIPYRSYYDCCVDLTRPEIISKIVYDNNIMFLFDISHARSSANHWGMTLEEYVSKLPMDRVVEFHLAGMYDFPNVNDEEIASKFTPKQIQFVKEQMKKYGKRADAHGKMNEEDYRFLEEAIKKYPSLKYVTLEYGSYNSGADGYNDEDYTYPVCHYDRINPVVKEEVLEQLTRIKNIVDTNVGSF